MEAIKSIARRTTQSLRERLSGTTISPSERELLEGIEKVKQLDAFSSSLSAKIIKLAKLMEEVGQTMVEIGDEFQKTPGLSMECSELALGCIEVGKDVVETGRTHQKEMNDNGYKVLQKFSKGCPKLDLLEEARENARLEYDFFKRKVDLLKQNPQTESVRILRNEQRLNNWRVELWKATEVSRATTSELYSMGRKSCDSGVIAVATVLKSYFDAVNQAFSSTFRLLPTPLYDESPLLPPIPLSQDICTAGAPSIVSSTPTPAPGFVDPTAPTTTTTTTGNYTPSFSTFTTLSATGNGTFGSSPGTVSVSSPGQVGSLFSSPPSPPKTSQYQPPVV